MELHKGSLYWPTTYKAPHRNKPAKIADCYDAVIVGGGMSGALTALSLLDRGYQIAILDKRRFASGSTSANTGLLQYSNDIMLHELIEQIGEKDAVNFYRSCKISVEKIKEVADRLPVDPHFIFRDSIYYASDGQDAERLEREYRTLVKYDFPCIFWDRETLLNKAGIDRPCAIVTHRDAEVNPYIFVNGIFNLAEAMGAHLFEYTEMVDVNDAGDKLTILTSSGDMMTKNIIFTTGYETLPIGKRIGADMNRSYVIVTEPLKELPAWYNDALIWETKRPYLYMRTTADRRIIIGGLDEDKGKMEITDRWIKMRGNELRNSFKNLFPDLELEVDYAYCATFGESIDNLPFIGEHPNRKKHYYLLGYGGNGTVYSMLGAEMLADKLCEIENPASHIVQLTRMTETGKKKMIL
ncbi:FAD-binding oxidoreductase [Sporosarcina sp. ACRSL]|uniref:NAD(P)/FAD-dependent oxidoreductase n=1 Tax=Sporosarcina sp. ACRSL TaxID=2918215 RepID=UPI001EF6B25A|nr:FAD-dependent oxidoreductase [Sporosarcina sp. ACRSL]MCG7345442.1 FAD-binding oxidoreductase [Sporosarcina sp. ACRSL]